LEFHIELDQRTQSGRHKGERVSGASVSTVGRLPGGG
jgi:hypothetical protein